MSMHCERTILLLHPRCRLRNKGVWKNVKGADESPMLKHHQGNHKTRQDKTRQDKTIQDKTRQDTRQDKTRQDKTRQDTRQDKTRQEFNMMDTRAMGRLYQQEGEMVQSNSSWPSHLMGRRRMPPHRNPHMAEKRERQRQVWKRRDRAVPSPFLSLGNIDKKLK